MSKRSWQAELAVMLSPSKRSKTPRIALVGIGHALRGDDAAGLMIIDRLQARLDSHDRILLLKAGAAPENMLGLLQRFRPDLVLLVDAAMMDMPPGATRILDPFQADGCSASTHTMPLSLFSTYLQAELGCDLSLLGIQAASTVLGDNLTPAVRRAVEDISTALHTLLAATSLDLMP